MTVNMILSHERKILGLVFICVCFTLIVVLSECSSDDNKTFIDYHNTSILWSDNPAFTCQIPNVSSSSYTSDKYDNIWEGDATPDLPRVSHPCTVKRWMSGEGMDYLDEETVAATGGKYTNPYRIWEGEPYPIGNGRLAASVFHGSGRDRYALNEVSFWSGGRNGGTINEKGDKSFNNEQGPDALDSDFGGSQPIGDFIVDFNAPVRKGSFYRKIDMEKGEVSSTCIRKNVQICSNAFISYPDQILVMHYKANKLGGINCTLSFGLHRATDMVTTSSNSISLRSELANGIKGVTIAEIEVDGGTLQQGRNSISIVSANSFTIRLAIETNYKMDYSSAWRGENPDSKITSRMKQAQSYTYDEILARHRKDFGQLYHRIELRLPSSADSLVRLPIPERLRRYKKQPNDIGLEEILFNFGRYLMISTSRPGSLPAGLQGIWNGMSPAPWGNDYHSNINFQMVYWLAEQANLSECHLSMIDYLNAMREPNRLATQEFLKATGQEEDKTGGWLVYTSHNPFGGHGWQINLPGSAWYGLHLWEHYAFTQDIKYLREIAYPMMRELTSFWMNRLKTLGKGGEGFVSNYQKIDVTKYPELASVPSGTLVVPEGWSPEHGPRGEDGVSHDQQIIAELFKHTLEAAGILHVDSAWAKQLAMKTAKLYQPRIGKKENLMEWMIDRNPETDHRHTSHLFAVYPGSQITVEDTPELAEAARKSLLMRKNTGDSRRGWAWAWRSMLWARLHDGERAHNMVQGLIIHNMLENMLASHQIPLQIDANYGIAAAMLEMLVQSENGKIVLLPAGNDAWKEGFVKGLKARGNITIDMSWKDGKVEKFKIYSPIKQKVKIYINGKIKEFTIDNKVCTFVDKP